MAVRKGPGAFAIDRNRTRHPSYTQSSNQLGANSQHIGRSEEIQPCISSGRRGSFPPPLARGLSEALGQPEVGVRVAA